jgi:uncharacterized membrane protein YeaQ/YmgE (transglycosylase-associated protein family)
MTHHHHEEEEKISYESFYYIVGLLSGLFTGAILEAGFIWVPILGIFGLLFTGFFLSVFVRGREDK